MPHKYKLTGSVSVQFKDPDNDDPEAVETDIVQASEFGHEDGDLKVDDEGNTSGFMVMKAFRISFIVSVTYEVFNGRVDLSKPVLEDIDPHFRISLLRDSIEVQVDYLA
ncbi:hypothetical protein [Achromobacter xylosoxidans]|uniref:Uncharacterized protein n=1 Tax=Alcaligenes xylosoxydans xylosoxydans TaxID=85698 RepID=A0A1R1JWX2_ALCXX|nr:hypothetical protein [Achromobacter xylosoxidans]OMG90610.1 hypothetical protein BIZ92_21430 [Achromobacter xylosoxidans]BEG79277.1 hypothetical protein HBIAX_06399 [Achromobacter xylosoxidans]